jgi:Xaa-Pro aminopeptidase
MVCADHDDDNSIEDDVVVTEDGIDNLTTAIKDPDEIEQIIAAARA